MNPVAGCVSDGIGVEQGVHMIHGLTEVTGVLLA